MPLTTQQQLSEVCSAQVVALLACIQEGNKLIKKKETWNYYYYYFLIGKKKHGIINQKKCA